MSVGSAIDGLVRKFMKYPVRVILFEKRGDSHRVVIDSACRIKQSDGTEAYHLKTKNKMFPPPDFRFLHVGAKGKPVLMLFSPQEGEFQPITIANPPGLKIDDTEMQLWHTLQARRTAELYAKKPGFLEKYAPYILVATIGVLLLFMLIYMGEKMTMMSGSLNSAAQAFKSAAETIAERVAPALR